MFAENILDSIYVDLIGGDFCDALINGKIYSCVYLIMFATMWET